MLEDVDERSRGSGMCVCGPYVRVRGGLQVCRGERTPSEVEVQVEVGEGRGVCRVFGGGRVCVCVRVSVDSHACAHARPHARAQAGTPLCVGVCVECIDVLVTSVSGCVRVWWVVGVDSEDTG